jgi:hypothetical protein
MSVQVATVPGMEELAKLAALITESATSEHLTIVLVGLQHGCGAERRRDDGGDAGASRWTAGPGGRRSCGRAAGPGLQARCIRSQRHTFNVAVADFFTSYEKILLCAAASVTYDPCREVRASSRRTHRPFVTLPRGQHPMAGQSVGNDLRRCGSRLGSHNPCACHPRSAVRRAGPGRPHWRTNTFRLCGLLPLTSRGGKSPADPCKGEHPCP